MSTNTTRLVLHSAALTWLAGLVFFSGAGPAEADITDCDVSSSGIVFSNYDIIGQSEITITGDLDITCSGTGSGANNIVTVDLSAGAGSCATRTMTNGGSTLQYNIYTASSHAVAWCSPTTQSYSFTFGASPQTYRFTMYGRVPAGQAVPWGTYSDSVLASVSWPGGAGDTTAVSVTQNAPAVCSLSASSLDFGNYAGATVDASALLSITCSMSAPYTISLDGGNNLNGTRRMAGPSGAYLAYGLYSDAGRSVAWGDGGGLGTTIPGTGSGSAQSLTVYGRAPGGVLPTPGAYSDTVVVTLTY
jgi:spore coat protein U-like protein